MPSAEGECVTRRDNTHNTLSVPFQLLKDATLYFSRSTPNLATVIPAMDEIDKRFGVILQDTSFHQAIRSSLRAAKATLNKYYSLTDSSEAYRIVMGTPAVFRFPFCVDTQSTIQFFILDTSSCISSPSNGSLTGSKLLKRWSTMNFLDPIQRKLSAWTVRMNPKR